MGEVLLSMSKIQSYNNLESLYKLRIRESDQLKKKCIGIVRHGHLKISVPNPQKLETTVKRRTDQKLRLRNFDARHRRIETGAVVRSRKGLIGAEGGKGSCFQWKEKRPVFARRPMQFPSRIPRSCTKPEHTAATPSEPNASRGRGVSRKRSIRGKSNHGSILRQP